MNKKGFELAISTLILIILGIVVLVGLIIAVKGGFSSFRKTTDPLYQSTQAAAIRESCNIACTAQDVGTYCCSVFSLDKASIGCTDSKLGVSCSLSCDFVSCG